MNALLWLSLAGASDSLYTALQQRFPGLFEFCFDKRFKRAGCEEVLHSRYAKLFVIPNSWLGVIGYSALAFIYGFTNAYLLGFLLSLAAAGMSYYLLYVQWFKLEKFCIFCLTSTALITVITLAAYSSL